MEMRIYCESIEQGLDFQEYIQSFLEQCKVYCRILTIYSTKISSNFSDDDSVVSRIRRVKDVDITLTVVENDVEIPLLLVEYSTAFPTDDHIMQRTDLMYWASLFRVSVMKISPKSKGVDKKHGGGSILTSNFMKSMANKINLVYYEVNWPTNSFGELLYQDERMACIPKNDSLQNSVNELLTYYLQYKNEYYSNLLDAHHATGSKITSESLNSLFHNSSRIQWFDNNIRIKINRFGHAMDPDRGVMFFYSQLLGSDNVTVEFQMQRSSIDKRQGYRSLYDGLANSPKIITELNEIYKVKNNNLSNDDMLEFFLKATNTWEYFTKRSISNKKLILDDYELSNYLNKSKSMAYKSLFLMTSNIVLTNLNRDEVLEITWNKNISLEYIRNILNVNFTPLKYASISNKNLSEDIITYVSKLVLQSLSFNILAISYPGAQGDRCMLLGSGRNTKRIYIDIIAQNSNSNGSIFLQENKSHISKSSSDIEKLSSILNLNEKRESLNDLLSNILGDVDYVPTNLYIGIGGYHDFSSKVDYGNLDFIMMLNFDSKNSAQTSFTWHLAIINMNIIYELPNMILTKNKIMGVIDLPRLFKLMS